MTSFRFQSNFRRTFELRFTFGAAKVFCQLLTFLVDTNHAIILTRADVLRLSPCMLVKLAVDDLGATTFG